MGFESLSQGRERSVLVYGSCEKFREWAESLDRPPQAVLWQAIRWVADRPIADLMRNQRKWIPVRGTSPKLYEIRKNQARLYCCMVGNNVYILDWAIKKRRRATSENLERAEGRAREVLENG